MKIGIAVRKDNNDYFIHKTYVDLLTKNNLVYDFVCINSNLDQYDGFLLPGGYDLNSKLYNENLLFCNNVDEELDNLDKLIILHCIKNKKPLLGICRGIQSINVFLKGSLKQNINNHLNNNHFIIYEGNYYLVNSFHHQSINKLGENLVTLAYSLDGEIEIIKHKYLPIIGVQFHPELIETELNEMIMQIFNVF